jgi:hypothetical protein
MELDDNAICSTATFRSYGPWRPSASRESASHPRGGRFLSGFAVIEAKGSGRGLGMAGTAVSSCSSSLAVPAVEFDTLSIDRRDIISSRVDAFIGRTEKREESAFVRVAVGTLEGVEVVLAGEGEWERDSEGGVDNMVSERAPDDGGGKNERLVEGTL